MNRSTEWNEFLGNLLSCAMKRQEDTKEFEYLKQHREHIDEMLDTNLTDDQKMMVDEVLYESGLAAERESEIVYQQGLKDCVWLLKNLGVLA